MKRFDALLVALFLVQVAFSQKENESNNILEKIRQVETQLTPGVLIARESPKKYSIADRMAHYNVPAVSIAVINDGKIEWARAYGSLGINNLKKADTLTLFQAASISKPLAALGALKLVEEGKLKLDRDVNDYLKGWKVEESIFTEKNSVTLREILSHTAGFTVNGFQGYTKGAAIPNLVQILNGDTPANSPAIIVDIIPGTRSRYSGGGYVVLQQMMQDVTGAEFASFMHQNVLSRIGMKHSTFQQPLADRWLTNASIGHLENGDKVPGSWNTFPEISTAGLWSTPSDIARYIIEVQKSLHGKSNKVLSQKMTKKMLTSELKKWGLGVLLGGSGDSLSFSHPGANIGYKSFFYAFAEKSKGAVIMTNSNSGNNLIEEILCSISKLYNWNSFKPVLKTIVKLGPEKLKDFEGIYIQPEQKVQIQIMLKEDHLMVKQLWDGYQIAVYPESDLDFFIKEEGSAISFNRTADGAVTSLLAMGQYRFIKVK